MHSMCAHPLEGWPLKNFKCPVVMAFTCSSGHNSKDAWMSVKTKSLLVWTLMRDRENLLEQVHVFFPGAELCIWSNGLFVWDQIFQNTVLDLMLGVWWGLLLLYSSESSITAIALHSYSGGIISQRRITSRCKIYLCARRPGSCFIADSKQL